MRIHVSPLPVFDFGHYSLLVTLPSKSDPSSYLCFAAPAPWDWHCLRLTASPLIMGVTLAINATWGLRFSSGFSMQPCELADVFFAQAFATKSSTRRTPDALPRYSRFWCRPDASLSYANSVVSLKFCRIRSDLCYRRTLLPFAMLCSPLFHALSPSPPPPVHVFRILIELICFSF